jgi:D-hydroxyproline dehydrogenase subunit beta
VSAGVATAAGSPEQLRPAAGHLRPTADVVVVGAGAVGAACAYYLTAAGFSVQVVDRGQICAGTSSACEGNLLVSDKEAGPELDLALYSSSLWHGELAVYGSLWEFEPKTGLIVAQTQDGAAALADLGRRQQAAGVEVVAVAPQDIRGYEPRIRPGLAGAAFYPQDAQVQPMLLTAHLLRLARQRGATVSTGTEVTGVLRDGAKVTGVRTSKGTVSSAHVVNAAGPWAGELAAMADVRVPVLPRRGFILVTQPMPPTVRRKVYAGEYVASTQSSDEGLQTSTVIEGTRSGTILIGSSRERVGFDRTVSLAALREIAASALALFPGLAQAKVIRSYLGFRPYCPDHLPVIGHDVRAPGLWHAGGHEGAGIGLSVGSARLLAQSMAGKTTDLDLTPFSPDRFGEAPA